jgi:heat shock protein HslJ
MKTFFKSAAFLIAAVVITMGVQSCSSVKPIDKSQLDGYWVLKTMNGQEAKSLFEGTIPSVEFNFVDSMVNGNAGCNNYFGKFTLNEKNEFSAPQLGMTMMMCVFKNAEGDFSKAMSTPSVLSIDENGLLTFTEKDKVVFQFAKGEKPAPAPRHVEIATTENVVGIWTLKTMEGEDVAKLFEMKKPTIEFDMEKGRVHGNAGCNNYNAPFEIKDGVITLGLAMSTKMACPGMDGESKFLKVINGTIEASIGDGDLMFYKDGKKVMTFSKE